MTFPLFRIDDIGASTKQFEQYGKKWLRPFSNFGSLKRLPALRMWGPYDELSANEWEKFFRIFRENHIVPLIAITACWVDEKSRLIPFPEKFPNEARVLKQAANRGEIQIANHGLTHCVVGKHVPRRFSSNRAFHREFLPTLEQEIHTQHLRESQHILETYFGRAIDTLVPPGNLWSIKTYRAAQETNIKKIMCARPMADAQIQMEGIEFIDDRHGVIRFHDRELRLYGASWLKETIVKHQSKA